MKRRDTYDLNGSREQYLRMLQENGFEVHDVANEGRLYNISSPTILVQRKYIGNINGTILTIEERRNGRTKPEVSARAKLIRLTDAFKITT